MDSKGKATVTFIAVNLLAGSVAYAVDQPGPTIHYAPELSHTWTIGTSATAASYVIDFSFMSSVERKIQKAALPWYVTPTVLERTIREQTVEQRPITWVYQV
ncbi:MAG: hypothetical protein HY592_02340 [Candidatus Omnitrophica bacterium]|nr:hypothetical protein [Candidatus Omnitrophota bacterium]